MTARINRAFCAITRVIARRYGQADTGTFQADGFIVLAGVGMAHRHRLGKRDVALIVDADAQGFCAIFTANPANDLPVFHVETDGFAAGRHRQTTIATRLFQAKSIAGNVTAIDREAVGKARGC